MVQRRKGRGNKTKNSKQEYKYKSHKVRNKFELHVAKEIYSHLPRHSKVDVEYETEKLPYTVSYNYVPDFIIKRPDGSVTYIEAKGRFDYADQRKMKAVRQAFPDLDIRILFESNRPVKKGSKMYYGDWADKYGFPWAVGKIPKEWI